MAWVIKFEEEAKKEFARLDRTAQERIRKYLRERIALSENPRVFGVPLRGDLSGLWKYRIGAYRVIAEVGDEELLILVVRIGHRRNVYGGH